MRAAIGALITLVGLLAAAGCAGEDAAGDAAAVDLGRSEGIVFPDYAGRDAPADARLTDAPAGQEHGASDATHADGPHPDLPAPDLVPPPDLAPPPDLVPPDSPAPACSLWSHYSCQPGSSYILCTSTCTLNPSWQITCLGIFTKVCSCIKNGSSVGTCSYSGTSCSSCQSAVSCCFKKF